MKNFAVPVLLLAITASQAIRIESVHADEPKNPAPKNPAMAEIRAEAVAKWHAEPYCIEPPDILSVEVKWDDSHAVKKEGSRLKKPKVRVPYKNLLLVGPDGAINIDGIAKIDVAGKTVDEVRKAIADKLPEHFGVSHVKIKVEQFNSKVVYVIDKRPSGDFVTRIPCTTKTNVLQILASKNAGIGIGDHVYIMTPMGHTGRPDIRLDVDVKALLTKNDLTTNYDLLPGDRIFVLSEDASIENNEPTSTPPPTEVQQKNAYYSYAPVGLMETSLDPTLPEKAQAASEMPALSISGDWHIAMFMSDGSPLPAEALKGSVATIKDGELMFKLAVPSVFDHVKIRFHFVKEGVDIVSSEINVISSTTMIANQPMKGTWSLTPETFQFCFAMEKEAKRPDLRAGQGLCYVMLERIRK